MGEATAVAAVLDRAGIAAAWLFGSRAAGTNTDDSDADIAVLAGRELGLLQQRRLADRLASALDVLEVDLVVLDDATLELRGRVIQEGRLLFSADEPHASPSRSALVLSSSTTCPPCGCTPGASCDRSPRGACNGRPGSRAAAAASAADLP